MKLNEIKSWTIRSIKRVDKFEGSLTEAIETAAQHYTELQPAYGVQVEDADGETVWDSEDSGPEQP